ncbi:hypothetical protein C7T35_21790 [Variovorax sp. WS11]|uniref:hypothetical protein n=1 Tax=Variovorax sp. WS11 TaxID=1105204 RepID=UPI000D0CED37|nr:hypothetical protein [Variovorax sp. WS11]NDZ18956.1 hypothetical protein [Variovorax sp. WS11]PSL82464.1 hypothetical protein C7T35_21790 [Variovorax sp. WS11]
MKYDIRLLTKAADVLLPKLTNPRHKAIISNYRRHALLEVCGFYEEILAPDMTVEEPDYWLYQGGTIHYKGMEKVRALYKSLVDTNTCVMMLEDEHLMVDDWGFTSESTFHTFMPAWIAASRGAEVDDLGATYIATARYGMHWPYDAQARMIGEHVYMGGTTFRKCPPAEVMTLEEVRATLAPLIEDARSVIAA